ncbi:MAG: YigZ family protein [Lachnospiraceae bacterium]|nr:YigZ family protein [Lachnospiraceae bacterium]
MDLKKTIYEGGSGEVVEKKSRFIGDIFPVTNEAEAVNHIAAVKKKYYDARHHCFAYIIGRNQDVKRFSDDGEPSGTAGKPMLDVLEREGIYNVCAVVTRYFGGTLLGTGGLVRAYSKAVQEGLENCSVIEQLLGRIATFQISYTQLGKIQYYCGTNSIPVMDTIYEEAITMKLMFPVEKAEEYEKALISLTEGQVSIDLSDTVEYSMVNNQVILL